MILPPFSAPDGFKSAIKPIQHLQEKACWLIFSRGQLLISQDGSQLPLRPECALKTQLYLGTLNETHLFAAEAANDIPASPLWVWSPIRALHGVLSEVEYALAGRAMQLLHWDKNNQYCGGCGQPTFTREQERCRECSSCGLLAYPKLSMAILALVKRDHQILLARGPHFPEPFFSAIAGFVDPGETLEQCVMREVHEEVGLKVKNIEYFGSQPWPLSHSMMIGFFCEWEEGEIKIDPKEIAEANWYDVSNLPKLPPVFSLSRILIDAFVKSQEQLLLA